MKPQEILGMVEEASGTRTFEERKDSARKTMQKKKMDTDRCAHEPNERRIQNNTVRLPALPFPAQQPSEAPSANFDRGAACRCARAQDTGTSTSLTHGYVHSPPRARPLVPVAAVSLGLTPTEEWADPAVNLG